MEGIKPKTDIEVQLTGEDGNIFNLVGIATKALKRGGYRELADELSKRLWEMESYDEALRLIMEYVEVR